MSDGPSDQPSDAANSGGPTTSPSTAATPTDVEPGRDPAVPPAAVVADRLERARRELLELSTRNRLLNTPRQRARSRVLEITGERADALYEALVLRGRVLHFAPAPAPAPAPPPESESEPDADRAAQVADELPSETRDPADPSVDEVDTEGASDEPALEQPATPAAGGGAAAGAGGAGGAGVPVEPGSAGEAFRQPPPQRGEPDPTLGNESTTTADHNPPDTNSSDADDSEADARQRDDVGASAPPPLPPTDEAATADGLAAEPASATSEVPPTPRPDDQKLQTLLPADELQRRLLRTFYDARSSQQEQGVNTLYLAVGFLRWFDPGEPDKPRDAPLLLLPCLLERQNARTRFSLRVEDVELSTNLSLQEKLRAEFGIELPEVWADADEGQADAHAGSDDGSDAGSSRIAHADEGDADDESETTADGHPAAPDPAPSPVASGGFRPSAYFAAVRAAVVDRDRWEVLEDDTALSFFSFSKFLMYRDLDPQRLGLTEADGPAHPLLGQLLGDAGFASPPPVVGPDQSLDAVIGPREMIHVVPADTSQSIAVEAVRQGRSLVIQGPPGTGKSQTIANLIAAAVHAGKKVLFVAEKMAALEVVQRRLANVGLGEMCLELHSHKATKRRVLEDLQQTLALGEPVVDASPAYFERLTQARETLNQHARQLHEPVDASGLSPYRAVGRLIELHAAGVAPPSFALESAGWSEAQIQSARQALADLLTQRHALGSEPEQTPWRGAGVDALLPMDLQRLVEQLPAASATLGNARQEVAELADRLGVDDRPTPALGRSMAHRARRLADAPDLDPSAITHPVWDQQRASVSGAVEQGLAWAAVRRQLAGQVVAAAYDTDLTQARLEIATHGRSWLGWLSSAYRRAKRQLASLLTAALPRDTDAQLRLIDQLTEARQARAALQRDQAIGRYAFGHHWRGEDSDWDLLGKIHGWDRRNHEHGDAAELRRLAAAVPDRAALRPLAEAAESAVASGERAWEAAARPVKLDLREAFGVDTLDELPLGEAGRRLQQWTEQPDGLARWINYRRAREAAREAGLSPWVDALESDQLDAEAAEPAFEFAYHEALLRHALAQRPELARFTGESHEATLQRFRQLDNQRLALARQEVAAAHHAGLPRGNVGQVGVLRREFQKKRRHLPLRVLLREAGQGVQAIKPVFMMSPMSVAQYLETPAGGAGESGGGAGGGGGVRFDLLLIDEASQVRPVDALGAVARCRQLVVVGDDKQLPPTRFFDSIMANDEDAPLDTDLDTGDLESILGLCAAQNMPATMLDWHYRSVHPSLIAVSNREFYDAQLHVIPSPRRDPEDLGLRFHHVTEGHFERGGSATHPVEARRIAEAVLAFARDSPHRSLGVGAFSVGQRDAILDELETLRRQNPEQETFFADDREEPFFVKNLENIQGDERDVIFISVGYGPDAQGRMSMNFGPLSNEGGERRLNVLITRAKRRLEVFSSITADDIDLSRVSKRGPEAFRTFLRYAQTGRFDSADRDAAEPVTAFERQVIAALREAGYDPVAHVGDRGFSVDLAVPDPDQPGRYLLGILTDGPAYGRCRSARERDASREQILQMRGWSIHRLWQLDWFNRPQQQRQQIVAALEAARAGEATATTTPPPPPPPPPGVERAPASDPDETAAQNEIADRFAGIPNRPYRQADFKKIPRKDLDDLDLFQRLDLVRRVVEIEGPVHREEVIRRAADLYRVDRLTDKLAGRLGSALDDGVRNKTLTVEGEFYRLAGQAPLDAVRRREDVASAGLRKPERLPPAEIRLALTAIIDRAIGVSREEAVIETSRLLGFTSTRRPLREAIEAQLDELVQQGTVADRGDAGLSLTTPPPPTTPSTP